MIVSPIGDRYSRDAFTGSGELWRVCSRDGRPRAIGATRASTPPRQRRTNWRELRPVVEVVARHVSPRSGQRASLSVGALPSRRLRPAAVTRAAHGPSALLLSLFAASRRGTVRVNASPSLVDGEPFHPRPGRPTASGSIPARASAISPRYRQRALPTPRVTCGSNRSLLEAHS